MCGVGDGGVMCGVFVWCECVCGLRCGGGVYGGEARCAGVDEVRRSTTKYDKV